MTDLLSVAAAAVKLATAAGATASDALAVSSSDVDVALRHGTVERFERAESQDVGVRVFVGQSSAMIAGSVLTPDGLQRLVDRAMAMARLAPPDPFAGLAEPGQLATATPDLDLFDGTEVAADTLQALARTAEDTALAVPGVTRSNGASASAARREAAMVASNGFARAWSRSSFGLSASVVAGSGTSMERDYDGHGATHFADLESAEKIGRTAGERAVARLNPRKLSSQRVPVLFDRRIATSIIGHAMAGISGAAIARGTSFLKDDMGKALFQPGVTIVDDPLRRRGLASRPFDGEGLPVTRKAVIDKGVLTTWILDLRSARQLGLAPTGNGARGLASPPSPSTANLHMEAGARSPAEMMRDLKRGFLVTEFIGSSINMVTGDYSRGASGFWFEDGEIAFPVSEVTVAGHLRDMFKAVEPANDLVFRGAVNAPTCYLGEMTLAGR